MQDKIKQLLSDIQQGDYKSLARGITLVENDLPYFEELLLGLNNIPASKVIGITGPPGAGKSTLVNSLLHYWTQQNKKICVIAVDPSSPFNLGALLGDRIRMAEFYSNPNVFIRSLASRGTLGGLSAKILEITDVVKNAPFDYIVIETVGVGQSEVEIAGLADCTVVTLVPEAGDEVQTIKAGIMEIADVFVVNKSDHIDAEKLYQNLRILAHEKANGKKEIPVFKTISTSNQGVKELALGIDDYLNSVDQHPGRKLQLLADKGWQLIEARRMKDLSRATLTEELRIASAKKGFNLYQFIKDHY